MGLFRRGRRSVPPAHGDYGRVFNKAGDVIGLWFESAHDARDSLLIGALLLKHDVPHLVGTDYRLVANTADDAGGLFVMFAGERAPGEPDPPQLPPEGASAQDKGAGEAGQRATRSLRVNGRPYPLHEDFDAFSQDAVAGKTALLKTTIVGLSIDDLSRLFRVMSAAFGDNSPETRAVSDTDFYCLTCFQDYSSAVLVLRDRLNRGGRSNAEDITECRGCGGPDAVWIYRPPPKGPS